MACGPLISTNENMFFKFWHQLLEE
jgi:hypothetical protein